MPRSLNGPFAAMNEMGKVSLASLPGSLPVINISLKYFAPAHLATSCRIESTSDELKEQSRIIYVFHCIDMHANALTV